MEFKTGHKKEITIIGYERREGNKNGRDYDITTFFYTEPANGGNGVAGAGDRTGEFVITGEPAEELREIIDDEGNTRACITGYYGTDYKFRVTSICTD